MPRIGLPLVWRRRDESDRQLVGQVAGFTKCGTRISVSRGQHRDRFRSIFVSANLALCPRVFERGIDAQTEASETYRRVGHPIDPAADARAGLSIRAVSERLKMSRTSVSTYLLRAREGWACGLSSSTWPGRGRRSGPTTIPPNGATSARYRRTELAKGGQRIEGQGRDAQSAMAGIPGSPSGWLWLYVVLPPVCRSRKPGKTHLSQPSCWWRYGMRLVKTPASSSSVSWRITASHAR